MNMKNKIVRIPLCAALVGALTLGLAAQEFRTLDETPPKNEKVSRAEREKQEPKLNTTSVKFSDPAKPGTLKVEIVVGRIEIQGTDGNEVTVSSNLNLKGAPIVDDEGFRRLDENEWTFEVLERDNVATVRLSAMRGWPSGAHFKIQVPRSTNIFVRTQQGVGRSGSSSITDINGDVDINISDGITLNNVNGSIVANSNNKLSAEFARAPKKAISLSSTGGGMEVTLPADAKANVQMRTMNGSIRTNFSESTLVATTVARTAPQAKNVAVRVIRGDKTGATTVTSTGEGKLAVSSSGGAVAYATVTAPDVLPAPPAPPSDDDLMDEVIAVRKTQALAYADKGLAAAQKGLDAAARAIDSVPGLSDSEKELIKRKIRSGASSIPATVRVSGVPSFGGKTIAGELNGGGVEIQLTTMNGNITLKQAK